MFSGIVFYRFFALLGKAKYLTLTLNSDFDLWFWPTSNLNDNKISHKTHFRDPGYSIPGNIRVRIIIANLAWGNARYFIQHAQAEIPNSLCFSMSYTVGKLSRYHPLSIKFAIFKRLYIKTVYSITPFPIKKASILHYLTHLTTHSASVKFWIIFQWIRKFFTINFFAPQLTDAITWYPGSRNIVWPVQAEQGSSDKTTANATKVMHCPHATGW